MHMDFEIDPQFCYFKNSEWSNNNVKKSSILKKSGICLIQKFQVEFLYSRFVIG